MPIDKKTGESKDEFISRCMSIEIKNGKPQDQSYAICISKWESFGATWSGDEPVSIQFETYNDYPEAAKRNAQIALDWAEENGWGSCGTPVGKQRANQLAKGENISRDTIARMAAFERHRQNSQKELGDGCGRLMWQAWGGDEGIAWAQKKLKQIDSQKLSKVKKVLFDEDFDTEKIKNYKDLGFKIFVRSKRKIKKKDRKVWNKLKSVGLSEDNLLYGEIKDLDKHHDFHTIEIGEDPILQKLLATSTDISNKRIIKSFNVQNMEDAEKAELELKNVEIRFVTVKVYYTYELRDDVTGPKLIDGSRDFCRKLIGQGDDKAWTLDQIKAMSGDHLVKMGLPNDPFQFRGGFYTVKGTNTTTPFCRHTWKAKIVIE